MNKNGMMNAVGTALEEAEVVVEVKRRNFFREYKTEIPIEKVKIKNGKIVLCMERMINYDDMK